MTIRPPTRIRMHRLKSRNIGLGVTLAAMLASVAACGKPAEVVRYKLPNNATFLNSIANFGQAYPWFEKRTTFRFTVGRTF